MSTPYSLRRGSTAGPPAIRVSLFARAIVFLVLIASTVGRSPAQPTIPSRANVSNQRGGHGKAPPNVFVVILRAGQYLLPGMYFHKLVMRVGPASASLQLSPIVGGRGIIYHHSAQPPSIQSPQRQQVRPGSQQLACGIRPDASLLAHESCPCFSVSFLGQPRLFYQ